MGKNYLETLQDLTELNGDGNRDRGRDGEDNTPQSACYICKCDPCQCKAVEDA
jgi:hypothetical protein